MHIRLTDAYLASAALILESGHSSVASIVFDGREYVELKPDGFGTFIFPQPVIVSDDGSIVLRQLIEPNPSQDKSRRALARRELSDNEIQHVMDDDSSRWREAVGEYRDRSGNLIIISDDGFVGVLMPRQEAQSLLNTIFATMITHGIQGEVVQDSDLCGFQWDSNSRLIRIIQYDALSWRVRFSLTRDDPNSNQFTSWENHRRTTLTIDKWNKILDRVYDYTTSPDLHNDLILAFEGYTLLFEKAYKPAYLYGWMIIEDFLSKLWETYVESLEGRSSKDKEALTNHNTWTNHHHIEMLSVAGKINKPTVRDLFNKMRKIRNDVVHNRKDISIDEAAGCLYAAVVIMLNRLNNRDPFLDLEKIKLVELWNLQKDSDEQPAQKGGRCF
jgi:hypothetical protein